MGQHLILLLLRILSIDEQCRRPTETCAMTGRGFDQLSLACLIPGVVVPVVREREIGALAVTLKPPEHSWSGELNNEG